MYRLQIPLEELSLYRSLGEMLDVARMGFIYQSERACSVAATSVLRDAAASTYAGIPGLANNVEEASIRVLREQRVGSRLLAATSSP